MMQSGKVKPVWVCDDSASSVEQFSKPTVASAQKSMKLFFTRQLKSDSVHTDSR